MFLFVTIFLAGLVCGVAIMTFVVFNYFSKEEKKREMTEHHD